ncbi:MAG TPA: pyridoxal-dependent decarboxylase [Candidimonas sp.]|nr:pyridoxal-dependent decarboxylase [Candidimonas sp.]
MDTEFTADARALNHAVELLGRSYGGVIPRELPTRLPEKGLGSVPTLDLLAPIVLGAAARLDDPAAFAHMDPPTPWITWATSLWNAALNQNLLHPATAPAARDIENRVIEWLAPCFGMTGGHMTPGSTLANLTGLWAARECAGVDTVVASDAAHLSVKKAAHILGLRFTALPTDECGALLPQALPSDMRRTALVLTAGTTSTGAIDHLTLVGRAAWTHVDAAWAGPLQLSAYADRLSGIEGADSVAVSAHKWLFQPKESALVLFRNAAQATEAVSFGGAYLAVPNVGLQGSHGAAAVPLLATLLAWGREGVAQRIQHCMKLAQEFADEIARDPRLELFAAPQAGIVVWRPRDDNAFDSYLRQLAASAVSTTTIAGRRWFRNVAANPNADVRRIAQAIADVRP